MFNSIIVFILIVLFFILGLIIGEKKIFPYNQLKFLKNQIIKKHNKNIFTDTSSKIEVKCSNLKKQKRLVFFTFGQSNSANHGTNKSKYLVKNNVINIYDNKCYIANDPLLGASGKNGSIWGRLSDIIIENTEYETILIKSIGIGGLSVKDWSEKPLLNRIENSINEIKEMGFEIDMIFWHQGEQDNFIKTKKEDYKNHFNKIIKTIRRNDVKAPISMAIASYTNDLISYDITMAQKELISENHNIFEGVNTDLITGYRDGVHFTETGLDKVAKEWFNSLIKEKLIIINSEKDQK